jgi:hypothetical protein
MLSTAVFDADAGFYLSGYDLHDPGTVNKVYAGAGDVAPAEKSVLYLKRGTWIGNEWPKPPGYPGGPAVPTPINTSGSDPRLGEVYLKSSLIDVKQGYAYFGHDNGTDIPNFSARVTKVQYSNKGSIKGDKITIPAGSRLSSVHFYSHTATPAYVDSISGKTLSSGNVRLAIYDDDGGNPSHPAHLIWDSGDIANSVTNGWITVSSGGTPKLSTLVLGGTYWLAWQVDSTKDVPSYTQGASNSGFITWQPYGAFPKTFTAAEDQTHKPSSLFTLTPPTQAYTNPPAPHSSPVYDPYTSNQDPNNPSVASVACYDGESSKLGGSIAHYRAELTSDNWSMYVAYRTQSVAIMRR